MTVVLGNCVHFLIQLMLLLGMTLAFGKGINIYWLYLPVIVGLEILFVIGLALSFSAIDVYVRTTCRCGGVSQPGAVLGGTHSCLIPQQYHDIYRFNPIAAVVLAFRNVLLDGEAPGGFDPDQPDGGIGAVVPDRRGGVRTPEEALLRLFVTQFGNRLQMERLGEEVDQREAFQVVEFQKPAPDPGQAWPGRN